MSRFGSYYICNMPFILQWDEWWLELWVVQGTIVLNLIITKCVGCWASQFCKVECAENGAIFSRFSRWQAEYNCEHTYGVGLVDWLQFWVNWVSKPHITFIGTALRYNNHVKLKLGTARSIERGNLLTDQDQRGLHVSFHNNAHAHVFVVVSISHVYFRPKEGVCSPECVSSLKCVFSITTH